MEHAELVKTLERLARSYPEELVDGQLADVDRMAFQVELVASNAAKPAEQAAVCDIGGGVGLFSPALAAAGFGRVVVVDDFRDPVSDRYGEEVLSVHRTCGVEVVARDVVADGLPDLGQAPLDAVTCIDAMEHFHNSPRNLFRQVFERLAPGGVFVLGTPNNVNLRKRISGLLGRAPWSALEVWYESPVFRGHVREPDLRDLRYIARDMGLRDVRFVARNWAGLRSPRALIRAAANVADHLLRLRPSLCSDIYMVGRKPAAA